jgi:hypothetical protein
VIHALTFASYAITMDGKPVLPHARAAVVGGRVLLPVRALGNALGADVGYDGHAHTITVQRGTHVATISARYAVRIVNGSAYAPLRIVADAFGMSVAYITATRTVALAQRALPAQIPVAAGPTVIVGDAVRPPLTVTVSPAPNAHVHDPYPSISARFAGAASIDPHSLQVRIDERDVSADTSVLGDQILITPRVALMPGTHVVTISGRDMTGFAFSTAPPPARFPVSAIWLDRWVTPGTNAFDVYVQGVPGMTGYVGVDGVGSYFPLQVYSANAYVAHVVVPNGVNQPFARIAARMTFPNGVQQTIVLPQTINLSTPPLQPMIVTPSPAPTPSPRAVPARRSVEVPSPSPSPSPQRRNVLTTTPGPLPKTPPPSHMPVPTYSPAPSPPPEPVRTRRPLIRRTPSPSPTPA